MMILYMIKLLIKKIKKGIEIIGVKKRCTMIEGGTLGYIIIAG